MADKPWKAHERKIARIFNTTRKLMKGTSEKSDIGGDDPDFPLILDCKLRKREKWQVIKWFLKVEAAAITTDDNDRQVMKKWPVVCVKEPGKVRSYAIVRREPIMKFIIECMKLPADTYFVEDLPSSPRTPILSNWDTLMKDSREYKRKRKMKQVIPMLVIHNTRYNIEIAVMKPEDLAFIFREGGLLKKEVSNDEEV